MRVERITGQPDATTVSPRPVVIPVWTDGVVPVTTNSPVS